MADEGFTIKCNKCGKLIVIKNGNFANDVIDIIASSRDGDIDIICDCGNEVTN